MRKWAKTQDVKERCWEMDMFDAIDESYGGEDCILCGNYRGKGCSLCPLYQEGYACNEFVSPWRTMSCSHNWGTWIINATRMAMIIKQLPEEK